MTKAVICLLVAACGYPPLDGSGSDANGSGSGTCAAPASYGSPTATNQTADFYSETADAPEGIAITGEIAAGSPGDYLGINLVAQTNEFPGNHVVAPTTLQLSGPPNAATCGACVFVLTKCPDPTAMTSHPTAFYMATGGTLEVDSVGSNAVGTLTNATFVHVSIDENSGATTVVNDGCTTKVDSAAFNVPIVDQ